MKKIAKIIGIIMGCILAVVVVGLGILTVTEYKPEQEEKLEVTGESSVFVSEGDTISVVTWNIGYGALGANADFFMDG